jgi:regulator of protease activity HflC (stomatin/prohibitin superfamily)
VQAGVLKEGTHRLNPFIYVVSIVNIQSQRVEFNGADAITFLTLDGFPVVAEGTLEFNISIDKAALLTHEIGDMEDVKNKLILPSARGFSRIEGSKKTATEFIVGESRQAFQNSLEAYLRDVCKTWGISVNSVLIRDIIPPQEIAGIIRDRELASQESKRIEQEIVAAISQAELVKQQALAEQNRQKVAAETERIKKGIEAEQFKVEKTVAAKTALDVATIGLDTAKSDAEALLAAAEAQKNVVASRNQAEADVLRMQVQVFPDEADYVVSKLYEATAPNLESILAPAAKGHLGLPFNNHYTEPAVIVPRIVPTAPRLVPTAPRASITPANE